MAAQFARAPHQGHSNSPVQHAPNAALLIDFDNVTMGIRSDLSKELKNLLNSHIIKGKVAVQRAYADWRRYHQYIVPLAEASVDLIFAPAYGSSKKNATDIRLAIDALELVFTRPEIGTFILLSGDSDFSSLVLKLKEYGKYVIGVGIRESASDLLVQNCDEYYSYSVLSGLTRESDEARQVEDPWTLVRQAVGRMVEQRDVMRSDRLKQVMLELDPNFNEKEIGYSKFSKFLTDAVDRGCLRLRKGENGQWEVAPADAGAAAVAPVEEPRFEARSMRDEPRRSRGGRGRRDGERPSRERREPEVAAEEPVEVFEPQAAPVPVPAPAPELATAESKGDLRSAFQLLRRAVAALVGVGATAARDSDVKRQMLELQPNWDESALGFSKFSRFLRQAHDAEAIDLRRSETGIYEVALPGTRTWTMAGESSTAEARPSTPEPAARPLRDRPERRGRARADEPAAAAERAPIEEVKPAAAPAAGMPAERMPAERTPAEAKPEEKPATAVPSMGRGAPATPRGVGLRIGSRGRVGGAKGPPPLLPGQAVVVAENLNGDHAPGGPPGAKNEPAVKEAEPAAAAGPVAGATTAAGADAPAESRPAAKKRRSRGTRGGRGKRATAEPVKMPSLSERFGLPTEVEAVQSYLAGYKGVGRKTAQILIEAIGVAEVFEALEHQPDRVREVLGGGRRADAVVGAWQADLAGRVAAEVVKPVTAAAPVKSAAPETSVAAVAAAPEAAREETPARRAPKARSRSSKARAGSARTGATAATGAEVPEAPQAAADAADAAVEAAVEAAGAGKEEGARRASRGGRRGGRRGARKKATPPEAPAESR